MKLITKNIVLVLLLSLALVSCRENEDTEEEKTEVERMMEDPDNKVEDIGKEIRSIILLGRWDVHWKNVLSTKRIIVRI